MKYISSLVDLCAAMAHNQSYELSQNCEKLSKLTAIEPLTDDERAMAYSLTGLLRCFLKVADEKKQGVAQ